MKPNQPPNVLLIMTDQHRGDHLGCDGHPVLETPNLDHLAAEGVRFRRAYSATPSCIPARATLMTGMDQWHTGILGMSRHDGQLHGCFRHTLTGELAAAGYHTQCVGKVHADPQRTLLGFHNTILDEAGRAQSPRFVSDYHAWFARQDTGGAGCDDHGMDWNSWVSRPSHLPEHLHPTHWTASQSVEWLGRRDPNKPFFLMTSFDRPHSPYDPPQVYYDLYRDVEIPRPHVGDWAAIHDRPEEADDVNAWRAKRSATETQRARACYCGSITFIDHQIGMLLAHMRREMPDEWRNTHVLFTSDHGDMLGDHHLWRKTYAYEGSARIPMIVRPPLTWDHPRGLALDQVVELRDVMPTLLAAAGIDVPDTCDGQSMLPLATDPEAPWREHLHGEHSLCYSHEQAMHYLTDGREKYVWFPYLGTEQLLDLTTDPGECRDLSADPASSARLTKWRDRLIAELTLRDCNLVSDGKLATQTLDAYVERTNYMRHGVTEGLDAGRAARA